MPIDLVIDLFVTQCFMILGPKFVDDNQQMMVTDKRCR